MLVAELHSEISGITEGSNYTSYRIRKIHDGFSVVKFPFQARGKGKEDLIFDIRWVVPYYPKPLRMFQCHFNAELCVSKVGSIKYLFKYICKGQDRLTVQLKRANGLSYDNPVSSGTQEELLIDESKEYQYARYLSATETVCRLRG